VVYHWGVMGLVGICVVTESTLAENVIGWMQTVDRFQAANTLGSEIMGAIRRLSIALLTLLAVVIMVSAPTSAQQRPNIVIIWGDDIGQ
jgi:hypothetical protein